jgi:hypothetical protein
LGIDETPTGAFSHAGRAYVFVCVGQRPDSAVTAGSYLTSKADPSARGNYRQEQLISPLDFSRTNFSQIAAVKIDNAEFPSMFPSSTDAGVVLFGQGHNTRLGDDAIHLAWSPLAANPGLGPLSLSYYTGDSANPFSANPNDALPLLRRHEYTSVSAAWLPGPRRWILIYGTANPRPKGGPVSGPVMARLAHTPFEFSSVADLEIFHPDREGAWGNYMHQPGLDRINPDLPPQQPPPADDPGWAYGAHLLGRYTTWDAHTGLIELYYLLSTSSPYQVQLMHTTIRFA